MMALCSRSVGRAKLPNAADRARRRSLAALRNAPRCLALEQRALRERERLRPVIETGRCSQLSDVGGVKKIELWHRQVR